MVKNPPANAGDTRDTDLIPRSGRSPGGGRQTHSGILAWRIPWTEEPGGLQFVGSHRVGYDWSDVTCTQLLCAVVLVSAVKQRKSAACIHMSPSLPSPTPAGHHRAPSWAPWAILRQLPTSSLVHTWSAYVSATLLIHPTAPLSPRVYMSLFMSLFLPCR